MIFVYIYFYALASAYLKISLVKATGLQKLFCGPCIPLDLKLYGFDHLQEYLYGYLGYV